MLKNIKNINLPISTLIYLIFGLVWMFTKNYISSSFSIVNSWFVHLIDFFFIAGSAFGIYLFSAKRLQEISTLQEKNIELTEIFKNANSLILTISKDLKIIKYSDPFKYFVLKHLQKKVYEGENFSNYLLDGRSELFYNNINLVLSGQKVDFFVKLNLTNSKLYLRCKYLPVQDSLGVVTHFILFIEDITESKLSEQKLQANNTKFETIFNKSEAALFLVQPNSQTIIDCNHTAVRLFEADHKNDLIGREGNNLHCKPWTDQELLDAREKSKNNPYLTFEVEYRTLKDNIFIGQLSTESIEIDREVYLLVRIIDFTKLKAFEHEAQNSKKILKSILDNTLESSLLVDKKMNIVFADNQLLQHSKAFFHSPIQLETIICDYVIPAEKEKFRENILQAFAGETIRQEKMIEFQDRNNIWIDSVFTPIRIENQQIEYVLFSFIDISHQKDIEFKLRQSEYQFKELANSSPVMIWTADVNGDITFYNNEWLKFRGTSFEQELGTWSKSVHPEDSAVIETYYHAFKSKQTFHAEYRIKNGNGEYRWILETGLPKFDSQDVFSGMNGSAIDITERKLIESKLIESEQRFKELANGSPVMIWTADVNGQITFYNNAWLLFRGRTFQEEIGTGWTEGVHPDDIEWFVNQTYYRSFETTSAYYSEYRLKSKTGEYRWIFEAGLPKFDAQNNFVGMNGSAIDITERKVIEQRLIEDERFITKITNSSPYLIYIYNIDRKQYTFINQDEIINLGIFKDQILTKGQEIFKDFIPEEDWVNFEYNTNYLNILSQKGIIENDFRIITPKFGTRWIQTRENIFESDDHGRIIQILGSAREITNKKAFEDKLNSEKKLNERITSLSPDIIYVYDIEKEVNIFQSRSITKDLGYDEEWNLANINDVFLKIIHPEDLKIFEDTIERYKRLEDNEYIETECRVKSANGDWHWLLAKEVVFERNKEGIPTKVIGNNIDITPRKKIEQELLNRNLELKIANEELDGFVYRASHDLRSPLTSVLGLINLLKMESKDSNSLQYLQLMQKSIEKLMFVIEDLINHSKNTRLEIIPAKLDLELICKETFEELKYLENADKITFSVNLEGNIYDFYSDYLRIHLLLHNLISNAIKYHVPSRINPFILISISKTEVACIIKISDNGAGIEEKHLPKIFEMFYRASRNSTGSGLGLYIVKGILEKIKGHITIDSEYDRGTTFTITLPSMKP